MSAFYDQASLVVVPSGYKSGKIYAQKPLTTDGQLTFTRASTATRVNASGLIETVASGVPRLDYLGSSCPKLQLEPQRTNKCPNSANYGDNFINTTATRNVVSAPTGSVEADRVLDDNTNGEHLLSQAFDSILNGQTYTVSCFFKGDGTGGRAVIRFFVGSWTYAVYNLANGTVTATDGVGTASIQNYGNGWYRCILTATASTDYTPFVTQLGIANSSNSFTYQGASNLGVYFWGYQAEQGAYVTSLILTTSAAVTRLADAASKTGISSLIGSTAGSVFFEGVFDSVNTVNTRFFSLKGSGTTYQNLMIFQDNQDGTFNIQFVDSSITSTVNITWTHGLTKGQSFKLAVAYASNDVIVYQNGVSKGTDTSYTPITFSDLYLQYTDVLGKTQTKQALLFKSRLTNAQLAELTTL
jgi:hypothetical protein